MKKRRVKKWIKQFNTVGYGFYIDPKDTELNLLVDLVCQESSDTILRNLCYMPIGYTGRPEIRLSVNGRHKLLQFLNAALLDYPPTIWERMWTLGKQLKSKVLQ